MCHIEPPSPEARRHLLLITKVLQSIANGVSLGKKEPFMSPLNEFLARNDKTTKELFNTLAVCTLLFLSFSLSTHTHTHTHTTHYDSRLQRDPNGSRVCKMLALPAEISIGHLDTIVRCTAANMPAFRERLPPQVAESLARSSALLLPLIDIRENQVGK